MSNDFIHELALEDVKFNLIAVYKLQKDSVAEMSNRSIINDANTMIKLTGCRKVILGPVNRDGSVKFK